MAGVQSIIYNQVSRKFRKNTSENQKADSKKHTQTKKNEPKLKLGLINISHPYLIHRRHIIISIFILLHMIPAKSTINKSRSEIFSLNFCPILPCSTSKKVVFLWNLSLLPKFGNCRKFLRFGLWATHVWLVRSKLHSTCPEKIFQRRSFKFFESHQRTLEIEQNDFEWYYANNILSFLRKKAWCDVFREPSSFFDVERQKIVL